MTPEDRQQQFQEERARQADDDLRAAVSTPAGRRVLWSIISTRAGAFRDCFRREDTHSTAYLEGRRSIALDLIAEVQRVAPSDYVHMLSEAAAVSERERIELEQIREAKRAAQGQKHGG